MKKNKLLLLTILILGVVYLLLSLSLVISRASAKNSDDSTSGTTTTYSVFYPPYSNVTTSEVGASTSSQSTSDAITTGAPVTTTDGTLVTTTSPVTTTTAPVTTTAPITTTNTPITTTAPITTTNTPITTTAPITTTTTPITTTAPITTTRPTVTTTAPITTKPITTQPPVTVTPVTTTKAPVTTTAPVITTKPVTTTKPITTAAPITAAPPSTTSAPVTTKTPVTTKAPVTTTVPVTTQPPVTTGSSSSEGDKLEDILGPAQITLLRPVASGVLTKSNSSAIIDYSNFKDGYVMVKYLVSSSVRLKVQVQGPTTTYSYNIKPFEWTVFPLSDGNGNYRVKVYKNVVDNRYSTVLGVSFDAKLSDEFAPFLRPNQYVNYENAINTMQKAAELSAGKTDPLEKVKAIYSFVVNNISYDYDKVGKVESGYLPDLDQVLATKKGICFDYASLMTGMLRSQNVACKLVIGYANTEYHAWINVWTPDKGWVDGVIFFDGTKWQLLDPTYASTTNNSAIINKVNYTTKYVY